MSSSGQLASWAREEMNRYLPKLFSSNIQGPKEHHTLISQANKQPIRAENRHHTRSPRGSVELQATLLARPLLSHNSFLEQLFVSSESPGFTELVIQKTLGWQAKVLMDKYTVSKEEEAGVSRE